MLMDRSVRAAAGLDAVPEHIKVGFSCFHPYYQGPGRATPGAADMQTEFGAELLEALSAAK